MAAFGEVTLILSPMFRQGPTGIYVLVDDEVGIKSLLVPHIFCVLIMSFCVHYVILCTLQLVSFFFFASPQRTQF